MATESSAPQGTHTSRTPCLYKRETAVFAHGYWLTVTAPFGAEHS